MAAISPDCLNINGHVRSVVFFRTPSAVLPRGCLSVKTSRWLQNVVKKRGLGWGLPVSVVRDLKSRVKALNMGLEERMNTQIGKLSGGQRQALTLLMASWLKPDLLLLDEHTAALDPTTAGKVIEMTKQIVTDYKLTTLMVTHSMQQAVNLGNRIIMMHQGKIKYDFSGEEKNKMKVPDLLSLFDELRRKDQIDAGEAVLLSAKHV